MERLIGTVSRGVRAPIIRAGDDIASIVAESVLKAAQSENIAFRDKDVVAVTEAVVARSQGNYANTEQIAKDIKAKFPSGEFGIVFQPTKDKPSTEISEPKLNATGRAETAFIVTVE